MEYLVQCRLCGLWFATISWTHLQSEHGIDVRDYQKMFPEASLTSEATRKAISDYSSTREVSLETRARLSLYRYEHPVENNPMKDFERWSRISRELWSGLEYREAQRKRVKDFWADPKHREAARQRTIEQFNKPGVREAASEKGKELWKDPDYVKKQQLSRHTSPNLEELTLGVILSIHFPRDWKFVGDFEVVIGGKNPDFININGQKKVIELFSYYRHLEQARTEDDVVDRINHYKQYGFDCLVLWTDEIYNEEFVVSKVKEFTNG